MTEQPQVLETSRRLHALAEKFNPSGIRDELHAAADKAQAKFEAWLAEAEHAAVNMTEEVRVAVKAAWGEFDAARSAALDLYKKHSV